MYDPGGDHLYRMDFDCQDGGVPNAKQKLILQLLSCPFQSQMPDVLGSLSEIQRAGS
jgi:hypothetical protein